MAPVAKKYVRVVGPEEELLHLGIGSKIGEDRYLVLDENVDSGEYGPAYEVIEVDEQGNLLFPIDWSYIIPVRLLQLEQA